MIFARWGMGNWGSWVEKKNSRERVEWRLGLEIGFGDWVWRLGSRIKLNCDIIEIERHVRMTLSKEDTRGIHLAYGDLRGLAF